MWGVEEKLIPEIRQSPVQDIVIVREREEKKPEILTTEEIRKLLRTTKEQNHPWFQICVGALLTGCRSGELHQLKKSDVELISQDQTKQNYDLPAEKRRFGFIRLRRSWNKRLNTVGPTKADYWRTIPISSEFHKF